MRLKSLQALVSIWCIEAFGAVIAKDKKERNFRFLEESLELTQACGMTKEEAYQLVEYVFNRPVGERSQEVGGVAMTFAALCAAHEDLDLEKAASAEYRRIMQPEVMEKIRRKQATKPHRSPLPGTGEVFAPEGLVGQWNAPSCQECGGVLAHEPNCPVLERAYVHG